MTTSHWTVSIRNETERNCMTDKEYFARQKEFCAIAKTKLTTFNYKSQKDAIEATNKLPKVVKQWVEINECFPVSLGLGFM